MKKTQSYLKQAIENTCDVASNELPSIDLYMDQVITLLCKGDGKNESAVTKTMINNYRKQDIIKPLEGKKYKREHIIQLLLILQLKNTLSIGEIEQILPTLYKLPQGDFHLKESYDDFLKLVPKVQYALGEALEVLLPKEQDGFDTLASLLILARLDQYIRDMASQMVSDVFPKNLQK